MAKTKSLDELKTELIGKSFGWLTVIDVQQAYYKGHKHGYKVQCKCKCGKITSLDKGKITSGHTKSCGCYIKSKEFSNKQSQWSKDNPDKVKEQAENYKRWCKDNPDKVKERANKRSITLMNHPEIQKLITKKHSDWCKNNPDNIIKLGRHHSNLLRERRISSLKEIDLSLVHPDDVHAMLAGNVKAGDKIRTRCPLCGNYAYHDFNNVINLKSSKVQRISTCDQCTYEAFASQQESIIQEYIRSIYDGECITNCRTAIPPFELDLFYPEKKIAVEYNGDYWHSNLFKDNGYHFNKFKHCANNDIVLVSVFEHEWNIHSFEIMNYIRDLFAGNNNQLSFDKIGYMNNNYPCLSCMHDLGDTIESYYPFRDRAVVFTCGYSKLLSEINYGIPQQRD